MNKADIEKFAVWARQKLRREIENKAGALGINSEGIAEPLPQSAGNVQFFDIGTGAYATVEDKAIEQREKLVQIIREKAKSSGYKTAYDSVIEQTAYTWFNRLIAVRFMEVNGYLPDDVRVLSSKNAAKLEPDIVSAPFDSDLRFTPRERKMILQMKEENRLNELFRFLFIRRCNSLSVPLPRLFEKTDDYTEILLNISFTDQDGVVYRLVHDIKEDDFNVKRTGQVQIIGWLYQFYNSELKDETFALLKKNVKVTKERIPSATQLFTPDWIVRYMVENSLGRIVINNLKYDIWSEEEKAKIDKYKTKWHYYLDEAEQDPEVDTELRIMEHSKYGSDEFLPFVDSTLIDPCMGSGHILVYAFDVFMDIYMTDGWTMQDAVRRIVERNLYGLDIDERATQLAYFSVMMKACEYDDRFLTRSDVPPQPNIYVVTESNGISASTVDYFSDGRTELARDLQIVMEDMRDASEYGSILTPRSVDFDALYDRVDETYDDIGNMDRDQVWERVLPMLRSAELLSRRYDVVVTNPPYMAVSNASAKVQEFVKKNYPDSKTDLFAVFIERCGKMAETYQAMITMHSWMFLSSFEQLREKLQSVDIVNMAHLGARAFDSIGGEVVQTTAFVFRKERIDGYAGMYCRLVDSNTENRKRDMFLAGENRYTAKQSDFSKIPGSPMAYWVSEAVKTAFNYPLISTIAFSDGQILTGNNERYLRYLWEVNAGGIDRKGRWVLHAKGGEQRRWYGNIDTVVSWTSKSIEHYKNDSIARFPKDYILFRKGITWSLVSASDMFSMRILTENTTFNKAAATILFYDDSLINYALGYLNSKVARMFLRMLNPTINTNIKDILYLPIAIEEDKRNIVEKIVQENIAISRADWDSFETSWDFQRHPLVPSAHERQKQLSSQFAGSRMEKFSLLSWHFERWRQECDDRFKQLKANEEELNRIFIDIYGLQDELTPKVEDRNVTVRRADLGRDIRSLVSYTVGCMFGRYSLDTPGLAFAGGDFDSVYKLEPDVLVDEHGNPILIGGLTILSGSSYKEINVNGKWRPVSFEPDKDNCLPITDEEYFEDDIVARFVDFVRVVFGEETLEENLDYIAKALGNRGSTSREVIRNYFLNDFMADHLKIYQKRPIYWMFDSGKQNGFKALVYMHRWNADTIGNVRVEYLHKTQRVYERELERMQEIIDNGKVNREIAQAQRRRDKLTRQLKETRDYDQRLAHLALLRINIDLDDGVKVNYNKVQTADGKNMEILAKIR